MRQITPIPPPSLYHFMACTQYGILRRFRNAGKGRFAGSSVGSYDGHYILQFLEDGTFALTDVTEAAGISIEQTGNWLYLGMTEAGIVLKHMLFNETDGYRKGALLLQAKGGICS